MQRISLPAVLAVLLAASGIAVAAAQATRQSSAADRVARHLADGRMAEALAAYDAHVSQTGSPDPGLLAAIGRAELWRQARTSDRAARSWALEGLAAAGEPEALQELRELSAQDTAGSEQGLAPTLSLIRLGDAAAAARLGKMLASADRALRVPLIRALQDANATGEGPQVAALLDDPEPRVRMAAAIAVGALGYRAALPRLKALYDADDPTMRFVAAIAMKRLGDPSADAFVSKLLASEVPEVRLMAAAAYSPSPRAPWTERIRELRNDRNELVRVQAAEVLACCDQATARAILADAFRSPLPPLRAEAARVLTAKRLATPALVRSMLGDEAESVRLHGASAALRLAKPPRP
jgi:HEAT repeat protein